MSELKRLPVFVFPSSITFFAEETSSHKQMITLYNPYDLVVQFKVLSTAPWKYRIIDPEGSIKPHCCVDIVIRHTAITPANTNVTDKFRIQMNEHNSRSLLGKKDISVTLLPGKSSGINPDSNSSASSQEKFRHFNSAAAESSSYNDGSSGSSSMQSHSSDQAGKQGFQQQVGGPNYIAIAVAVICIIALMLPSSDVMPSNSSFWSIFYLSSHQKMVFAYSLGLVTMVILRV